MMNNDFIQEAHTSAVAWANELLAMDPATWVILDTETTGLGYTDEVVQIGIVDGAGHVLLNNRLVQPTCLISEEARSVHGISAAMVEGAPSFRDVMFELQGIVKDKMVVIYNAEFDVRMLRQTGQAHGIVFNLACSGVTCAMIEYAKWFGDWSDYRHSFKWQRLPQGDHTSVGDCLSVLRLISKMSNDGR